MVFTFTLLGFLVLLAWFEIVLLCYKYVYTPRRRSGSSIVVIDGDDLKPCLPDDYISGQHYRQPSDDSKEIDQEMLTMLSLNQDNGPHREMAVDCPDNFIARNKTPPRYPPPRPPQVIVKKSHEKFPEKRKKKATQQQQNHTKHIGRKHKNCIIHTKTHNSTISTLSSSRTCNTCNISLDSLSSSAKPIFSITSLSKSSPLEQIPFSATSLQYLDGLHYDSFSINSNNNNTLPKCTKFSKIPPERKLLQNFYYFNYSLKQPHDNTTTTTTTITTTTTTKTTKTNIYHTRSMIALRHHDHDYHDERHLRWQNLYNQQRQLKLEKFENDEKNNGQLQSIKMSSNVVVKSPKVIANANPNGGLTTPTEDLELMVDGLYRKNSSSHSSSFGSEILSKKQSPESYDSISYQNLQHNNNELNSGIEEAGGSKKNSLSSSTSLPNSSNSSPTSSNSTNSAVTKNLFNQAVANTMVCGVGVAGIDSLTSLNSSSSTPPPEYELREFTHKQLTGNILPAYRKHRELPVDAPDSFIEIIKTTPRYPPPAHLSSLTSQLSSCSSTSTANTTLTRFNSNKNTSQRHHHHHLQQQQQQETSLISTMSLNGSFEDYQQQQQQQFHHLANGKQQPQPQVAVMNGLIKSSNKHNEETTYLESTHAYLASHNLNGSIKPIPPPRDLPPPRNDSKALDGRLVINRNSSTIPPQLPDRKLNNNNINNVTGHGHHGQQIAQIVEPTLEQLDSIKKYQVSKEHLLITLPLILSLLLFLFFFI
uniref:Uncharacterized protein n=1 Tax=Glossina palpalis gambiensis TaxID=67801 RepID=A0A1B0AN10_9MUSC